MRARLAALLALALVFTGCTWPLQARVIERAPGVYDVLFPVAPEADPLGEWEPTPEVWEPTATPAPCVGVVTSGPLNVRAEPNVWATVRGQLGVGDAVTVEAQSGGWLDVGAGWVWAEYVRLGDGC